jgi:hypothetical protein
MKMWTGIPFMRTSIGVSGMTPRGGGDVIVSGLVYKHVFSYLTEVVTLYKIPRL